MAVSIIYTCVVPVLVPVTVPRYSPSPAYAHRGVGWPFIRPQSHPWSLQDFDRLLETLRVALANEPATGFVFSCLSGRGRTTMAMVLAVLAFWHIRVLGPQGREVLGSLEPGEVWSLCSLSSSCPPTGLP